MLRFRKDILGASVLEESSSWMKGEAREGELRVEEVRLESRKISLVR